MTNSSTSDLKQTAGFFGDLIRQARLVWRLLRDGRIPGWAKLIPAAGLVYLLFPIDLFPDIMMPGLSQLDDLAVILLSLKVFVEVCPPGIVREHLERLAGKQRQAVRTGEPPSSSYIDVPYRVLDPEKK